MSECAAGKTDESAPTTECGQKPSPTGGVVRVLLIDDDVDDYHLTRAMLEDIPGGEFRLDWTRDPVEAVEMICGLTHDVYLIDYRLGAQTGLDVLKEVRHRGCNAPFILLTGQTDWEVDLAAMKAGATDYLEKGRLDSVLLDRAIRYAMSQKRDEAMLEQNVRERTAELEAANTALQHEVAERTRAEQKLLDADRRKNEYIATLAHELRNPLAPVRNALEIMRLANNKPEVVEQSRAVIERQVKQMVRLIDDLLDVSRISQGKLRLVTEAITAAEVVEFAVEVSGPQIERAGLTFDVRLPAEPIALTGDRVRLAQVLTNLLNNAAKYTEPGGRVTLEAAAVGPVAQIRVRDTGVGIPPEKLPELFDMFTQVDRSLNRSQGGLGIGLALARRLVELHGGSVTAHSDGVGRGAEFVVTLPRAVE